MLRESPYEVQSEKQAPASSRRATYLKIAVFGVLVVACAAVAIAYTLNAVLGSESAKEQAQRLPAADAGTVAAIQAQPHALVLRGSADYGRVGVRPLTPGGEAALTPLGCMRVYFAAGSGLCLGSDGYRGGAYTFDAGMNQLRSIDIGGLPSRVRISPDGRFGSMTVFVSGHSYLDAGLSTRTAIIDMTTGAFVLENLEELAVYKDGDRFEAVDFNYWGVTFVPDTTQFYATLMSGNTTYLIKGDFTTRRADILKTNVECPSLASDATRLVYKKRESDGLLGSKWRLHVLDLATMTDRPLAETRSVDDQVEWLDNGRITYFLPDDVPPTTARRDIWSVSVDDDVAPQLMWEGESSAAIVRAPAHD